MAGKQVQTNGANGSLAHANEDYDRAGEVQDLLTSLQSLIVPFIARADSENTLSNGGAGPKSTLVDRRSPEDLAKLLNFQLPEQRQGKEGLMSVVDQILQYSVNTWDRGFLHKLSGSTNAVGLVSELLLAALNANLHVYDVSPVLTTIEKSTARALARLFNLTGPYAGGVTMPGGSASNITALVIARNQLFPETKAGGYEGKKFVMFTSAHGHYSIEKAAQICGMGISSAWPVPVDSGGRMIVSELDRLVKKARAEGFTPFFVSASGGTTVRGAFDPFQDIAKVCQRENLWFHIDASWGGPVVFSEKHRVKMIGSKFANTVTVNPHKMMGVPLTCSFLLGADLRQFRASNTCPAGYLFHGGGPTEELNGAAQAKELNGAAEAKELNGFSGVKAVHDDFWDLADLTLQCGRKGDSLKLALGWVYYGTSGYGEKIDNAFAIAGYFATLVEESDDLELVGNNPPPCLQVCFYYSPGGQEEGRSEVNTWRTKEICRLLVKNGFLVDFAPGDRGSFVRAVVHIVTTKKTVDALVKAVVDIGKSIERV